MDLDEEKIEALRKFFKISVIGFEAVYSVFKSIGTESHKSRMHCLHLEAKEEIEKENPDLIKIDKLLEAMELQAAVNSMFDTNVRSDKFEKGGIHFDEYNYNTEKKDILKSIIVNGIESIKESQLGNDEEITDKCISVLYELANGSEEMKKVLYDYLKNFQ